MSIYTITKGCEHMRTSAKLSDMTLANELHPTLNDNSLDIVKLTAGSHKKLWWECSKNEEHEPWFTSVRVRVQGAGCPTCAGKIVERTKSIEYTHPVIAEQLDSINQVSASSVTAGSNKTYVWSNKECGHVWEQKVYDRTKQGPECPVCQSNIIIEGVNSLFDKRPDLKTFWSENNILDFTKLSLGSHKEVEWVCSEGHIYKEKVVVRVKRKTCPVCAGRLFQEGINDLVTIYPSIEEVWSDNNKETANQVVFNTKDEAVWNEKCGHTYSAPVKMRVKHEGCLICKNIIVVKGINDLLTTHSELAQTWGDNNEKAPYEVSAGSAYRAEWECGKGHEWEAFVYSRTRGSGCPQCNAVNFVSKGEQELLDIVSILAEGKTIEQSNRKVLQGQELDILIPEINLAVEFNGLYWHNENSGKDNRYHQNKMLNANKAGIKLIQVWEDEWVEKKAIVIRMLASKMNASVEVLTEALKSIGTDEEDIVNMISKHGARECVTEEITYEEATAFLNDNHIQGPAKGTLYTALKDKQGTVRAVMVSLKKGETWEIVRYATFGHIPGGFTKLISNVEKKHGVKKWVTFSDGIISEGSLYKNNGFVKDKTIDPDYKYIVNGERVHKFNYRLKRFRNDPTLQYVEGHTERQLAELNGIPRIWDAGKIRWLKITAKGGPDE